MADFKHKMNTAALHPRSTRLSPPLVADALPNHLPQDDVAHTAAGRGRCPSG